LKNDTLAIFFKVCLRCRGGLAAISLSPGSAQAYVVTVGGVQYDVTTFTGSYNDNTSKFGTAANTGVMPWWGDSTMAQAFAVQVGSSLGLLNVSGSLGPFFGYQKTGNSISNYRWVGSTSNVGTGSIGAQFSRTWAQATLVPAPGPLPLFGAAAAFGFSRKLRKRIKLAPGDLGSALPQA
jgi:hypothetical protein